MNLRRPFASWVLLLDILMSPTLKRVRERGSASFLLVRFVKMFLRYKQSLQDPIRVADSRFCHHLNLSNQYLGITYAGVAAIAAGDLLQSRASCFHPSIKHHLAYEYIF